MNWNKYFILTSDYPWVEDRVGIYPDYKSCFSHITKHILDNDREPWEIIFDVQKYKKNVSDCQITDKIVVDIYEEIIMEIERSVHFLFLTECFVYVENYQGDNYNAPRVYGVSPFGLILILSKKNVLSFYFPGNASRKVSNGLHRFYTAVNKVSIKVRQKKAKELKDNPSGKSRIKVPFFGNKNRFTTFLQKYKKIEKEEIKDAVKILLREEKII